MPDITTVFEAAHAHVMKWEGGFFDHPNDPGGVTNFGVSLMFLKGLGLVEGDIDGDGDIDRADILAMTKETASDLFRRHFWDKPGADDLPPLVAVCFYDLAVNAGAGRSAKIVQEGINRYLPGSITELTPTLGPLTRKLAKDIAAAGNAPLLCEFILDERAAWYRRLARNKPKSGVFLKGWLNRTEDCRGLVKRLAVEWGV